MITDVDKVYKIMEDLQSGKADDAGYSISEDFMFSSPERFLNKQQFLDLHRQLHAAIPDWSYNAGIISEHDNTVTLVIHITGTNTGAIELPVLGIERHPATGKVLTMPYEPVEIHFLNGNITRFIEPNIKGGGLEGLLRQLGIDLPSTAARR
jgi:hypothetical protein